LLFDWQMKAESVIGQNEPHHAQLNQRNIVDRRHFSLGRPSG
jgi:hypothetical protein